MRREFRRYEESPPGWIKRIQCSGIAWKFQRRNLSPGKCSNAEGARGILDIPIRQAFFVRTSGDAMVFSFLWRLK